MRILTQSKIVALLLVFFNIIVYAQYDSCAKMHPSCVFISAVGLSGSTTLTDILNQHPQVHIRGENQGMFNSILKIMREDVQWGLDYEQTLKNKEFAKLQNFSTISYEQAYGGVQQMFKFLFGHDGNKDKMVGFKEIRFSNEEQLDFVRGLCQNTKIIFQYHTDTLSVSKRLWNKHNPRARQEIQQRIGMFHIYNQKHPNDTFISVVSDFRKPDYLKNLFDFLGLSLEGVDIEIGRMYKEEQKQMHQQKKDESKSLEETKTALLKSQFTKSNSTYNVTAHEIAKEQLNGRIKQFFGVSHGALHQRFQHAFNMSTQFQNETQFNDFNNSSG
eukprot:TRINITY_DN108851_c0_g1_i1.p1 TRINITY_DN108851_c0_g1~~TRINITY_DN108851_c0_g1_i1.p1  ORF type:complete len:330 (+),score=26.74 TRINITY_DN108851_c0_g1_i1:125-1114(+)